MLRSTLVTEVPESRIDQHVDYLMSPAFRRYIQYDPAVALSKLRIPVLAMIGEKDLQVPPEQNLPRIREALEIAGNKDFEVTELPGLNHLFQTAKTGESREYGEIEETISPVALERISGWILSRKSAVENHERRLALLPSISADRWIIP